ncbi:hypothetical protein FA10DRAFT_256461 [Acaromyces ingoldii]|uniref:Diphthine--ammonia ligase n=1 Tax=Acaromyces ingoldii TaxID=215250 RepID=A0A316YHB2_9BASI|nr:hypothetical protein FA10DRAFT_256461 [Acaromyces ingoldii]PWN87135.1 hypothetical protein FA10DRAFT_256461 [Acaromyces ingoldii]
MKVVGLLSGGKDSCYNLCQCVRQGHEIVALATLAPPEGKDELDSYMYQTVGHDAIHLIAQAMDLPLYRTTISGTALNQTSSYGSRLGLGQQAGPSSASRRDETEDLYELLRLVKAKHPEVDAVSVGAILSNYQRVRVEHVAMRPDIAMQPLAFLWLRNQAELLGEMCSADVEAILIKVAGIGLESEDLGRSLKQMRRKLMKLNAMYGAHVCGEGGEYETFTLDCPLFKKRIVIDQSTSVLHSDSSFASVSYLRIDRAHLEEKNHPPALSKAITVPPLLDSVGIKSLDAAKKASPGSPQQFALERRTAPRLSTASQATTCRKGCWLAIAGLSSPAPTPAEEFRNAFDKLLSVLQAEGLSSAHLAHINVYLSNQSYFAQMNKVYSTLFGADPPSRACIALGHEEPRIVLEALAMDDGIRYDELASSSNTQAAVRPRRALHVQSRSYWAAANIGPYSQAVNAFSRITIAGQIGLVPAALSLPPPSEEDAEMAQIALSLQHARRIFKAVLEDHRVEKRYGWIEGCICWVEEGSEERETAKRLNACRSAWDGQGAISEEDDEQGSETWDEGWLQGSEQKSIPVVYAVLPRSALPRGAIVEWQLVAHDGRRVAPLIHADEDDDDDDDEGEAGVPVRSTFQVDLPAADGAKWRGEGMRTSSKKGASSFGIAALSRDPRSDDLEPLSSIIDELKEALWIRVLFNGDLDEALQLTDVLRGSTDASIQLVPTSDLFDSRGARCEVALVWQAYHC